jgi:hypothetical protein
MPEVITVPAAVLEAAGGVEVVRELLDDAVATTAAGGFVDLWPLREALGDEWAARVWAGFLSGRGVSFGGATGIVARLRGAGDNEPSSEWRVTG